jgi:aminoglycoside phosphotransferase (APT) family kinase protein
MTDQAGFDVEEASRWLGPRLPGAVAPLRFELIAAGGSNLTYAVSDVSGNTWAMRRPPVGRALATAHDMAREWRIIKALAADGTVPVPEAVVFCDDPNVIGADFYVMGFVEGRILRDRRSASRLSVGEAERATQSLVEVQVTLHGLDLQAVGLDGLGRHTGYVQRQLKRWRGQVREGGARELPLHSELHQRLLAADPGDLRPPALVHGDYRFDNCVLAADGKVAAVLDWELTTVGDPVADFAWSLRYWADPSDGLSFLTDAPTLAPAFGSRAEYQRRYEDFSGLDLTDLDYFEVFSWWKQASIVEGVYARRLAGSGGGMTRRGGPELLAARVDAMLARAAELAKGIM